MIYLLTVRMITDLCFPDRTVIFAFPAFFAVITPFLLTAATFLSEVV